MMLQHWACLIKLHGLVAAIVKKHSSSSPSQVSPKSLKHISHLMRRTMGNRAVLGIEPRTSRTQSENHATRPNSQVKVLATLPNIH
jgi:hypothetical protein